MALRGLAVSSADGFATPLGLARVDQNAVQALLQLPGVTVVDEAHALEHALEVEIPFLQEVLEEFEIVPVLAGEASPEEVTRVIEAVWGGDETRFVISSDLSHYLDSGSAARLDLATARTIEALDWAALGEDQACGRVAIRGLLLAARRREMTARTLDLRNSGDTAGPRDQVVGYGAFGFTCRAG
jgi:AmmeMemoRadiSam system protein B